MSEVIILYKKRFLKRFWKSCYSATNAPSVGFSQPWRFVMIQNEEIKGEIYSEFEKQNTKAKKIFAFNEQYCKLKLEGKEAPLNIAVLYQKPKKRYLGKLYRKRWGSIVWFVRYKLLAYGKSL